VITGIIYISIQLHPFSIF